MGFAKSGDPRVSFIHPPSVADPQGSLGLSDDECQAIHDQAYRLMADGLSLGIGVGEQDGGFKMVFVLDIRGDRYTIARGADTYVLFDPALGIIASNSRLDDVLGELRNSMSPLETPGVGRG